VQAVAISGGRFLAVGSNDEVLSLTTAWTRKFDLGGKTVPPGFIDFRAHPCEGAWTISALSKVDGKTPDPRDGRCEHDAAGQASKSRLMYR